MKKWRAYVKKTPQRSPEASGKRTKSRMSVSVEVGRSGTTISSADSVQEGSKRPEYYKSELHEAKDSPNRERHCNAPLAQVLAEHDLVSRLCEIVEQQLGRHALTVLARTCKAFQNPACCRIWQTLTLGDPELSTAFVRKLERQKGNGYAQYVKVVNLSSQTPREWDTRLSDMPWGTLIRLFPPLHMFTLSLNISALAQRPYPFDMKWLYGLMLALARSHTDSVSLDLRCDVERTRGQPLLEFAKDGFAMLGGIDSKLIAWSHVNIMTIPAWWLDECSEFWDEFLSWLPVLPKLSALTINIHSGGDLKGLVNGMFANRPRSLLPPHKHNAGSSETPPPLPPRYLKALRRLRLNSSTAIDDNKHLYRLLTNISCPLRSLDLPKQLHDPQSCQDLLARLGRKFSFCLEHLGLQGPCFFSAHMPVSCYNFDKLRSLSLKGISLMHAIPLLRMISAPLHTLCLECDQDDVQIYDSLWDSLWGNFWEVLGKRCGQGLLALSLQITIPHTLRRRVEIDVPWLKGLLHLQQLRIAIRVVYPDNIVAKSSVVTAFTDSDVVQLASDIPTLMELRLEPVSRFGQQYVLNWALARPGNVYTTYPT